MRHALRRGVAASLLGLASCSLWVSSEPEQIGCAAEGQVGPPACDTGFVCGKHMCLRCGARELCGDTIDNDCNGRVDEGCLGANVGGGSAGRGQGTAGAAKPVGVAGAQ